MNYRKHYFNLVNSRQNLNRSKKYDNVYYERHHIIPKCFGGGNDKSNLVLLTAKEHFIAHLLLVEMYEGQDKSRMSFALFQMCRKNSQHQRLFSARQFEKARQIMSINCRGINSFFFGKTHTVENKKRLSDRMKLKNPMKGITSPRKGKKFGPLSEEQRKKQSEIMKLICLNPEIRKQRSEAWKYRKTNTPTEETKKKISETAKRNFANKSEEAKLLTKEKIKKKIEEMKGSFKELERRRKISEFRKLYKKM